MSDTTTNQQNQTIHGSQVNAAGDVNIGHLGDTYIYETTPIPADTLEDVSLTQLQTPFGLRKERQQLFDVYNDVLESERGRVVLLMSKPSYGRHALIKQFTKETPVIENYIHHVALDDEPKAFHTIVIDEARKNAPRPTLFIIENLEQGAHWIDDLRNLAQIIVKSREDYPVMLLISITAYWPLAEMSGEQHTEPTRFAQRLLQDGWATVIELGRIDEDAIYHTIAPADPLLAGRLYALTAGIPYWSEAIWEEWKASTNLGVAQDGEGVWQAVKDEAGELTVYDSVVKQVQDELDGLLHGWEDVESPYSLDEAMEILQCAATEGERFTVGAVAVALGIDRDDLLDFFDEFLEPYVDEEEPENSTSGVVEWGSVQIDPVNPEQEFYTGRTVVEYRFARPFLYYVWRNYPQNDADMDMKRAQWKAYLGIELERLYWPYGEKIVERLLLLTPRLAEPYQRRLGKRASLEQLRYQVHMLQSDDAENQYVAYRLFDVGIQLLGRLAKNPAASAEGMALGEDLHARALHWQDVEFEANIARICGQHLLNAKRYGEALPLNKKAVDLCEEHDLKALLYAGSLDGLAATLKAVGDYEEARPLHERALAIRENQLDPDHPDTATSLNNLAELLRAMGEYGEARPFYERALAITEKALGSDHPSIATILNNLALLAYNEGDKQEAARLMRRALTIWEKTLGDAHPHTQTARQSLATFEAAL